KIGVITRKIGVITRKIGVITRKIGVITRKIGVITRKIGVITRKIGVNNYSQNKGIRAEHSNTFLPLLLRELGEIRAKSKVVIANPKGEAIRSTENRHCEPKG
ncbi:MAG: hypothetical protein LBB84_04480, partial [Tannerellaceae bacterium]|nr:hypothetical protein [Tannerellaceae bacterium]